MRKRERNETNERGEGRKAGKKRDSMGERALGIKTTRNRRAMNECVRESRNE